MKVAHYLKSLFACPNCKRKLTRTLRCGHCHIQLTRKNGIWRTNVALSERTDKSARAYDLLHQSTSHDMDDGSYETLGMFARGTTSIDIACGDGYIERYSPTTVAVDFSLNALRKAQKNGAKYCVQSDVHQLPFRTNAFEICFCSGSLEHFEYPAKAFQEMARISKIQVLTVHRELFWGANNLRKLILNILSIKDQPIEKPLRKDELLTIARVARVKILYFGYWNLPYSVGIMHDKLKALFANIPSCYFMITSKTHET